MRKPAKFGHAHGPKASAIHMTELAPMKIDKDWPALDLASWAPTKKSLHLYAQMLGKLRLALAPHQPNFMFTSLALTPRGFTTGVIPYGLRSITASLDVFTVELLLQLSDGRERRIPLAQPRTVARVFAELQAGLAALDVSVSLSPIPQEIPDKTPLDVDDRPAVFEPSDAQRWLTVMSATNAVFDRWRAHFFGRTGIALWWGGFDFALLLFSGKHVEAPANRGYLFKYDLDAEMMNVGFYPGDAANAAIFYGYIYPQPAACSTITIAPENATWSDALGEWILPYDAVRGAADPEAALTAFMDAIYGACAESSGWNHEALRYVPPPLRRAPRTR
jgi:hypothetical protein